MKWISRSALNGELFTGTWLSMGSPLSAEVVGITGFDWALIDLEHGSGDLKDLYYQLMALEPSSTSAIVRVPAIDPVIFKGVLDLGPAGLMVPHVSDVAAASRLVDYARIPPLGLRGAATSTRASGYGSAYREYLSECNENLMLIAQIESIDGMENADAIAKVDGIDVLFVGPTDLSIALGVSHELEDPVFRRAIVDIAKAASENGKTAGALVRNPQEVPEYLAMGYTFLSVGSDRGMIYKGMQETMNMFRSLRVQVRR